MSTKSALISGNNFDLYQECFDDESVYLEIENTEFIATENSVTVKIPIEIWNKIVKVKPSVYSLIEEYADKTDSEIENEVAKEVAKEVVSRLLKYHRDGVKIASVFGFGVYGDINTPIDEQLENGITYFKAQRERALLLKARLEM